MRQTILAIDIGAKGAMVLFRFEAGRPPEVALVFRWQDWGATGKRNREDEIAALFALTVKQDRPKIVAVEKPFAKRGRGGIGLSQASKGQFLRGILWQAGVRCRWMQVPPRGEAQRDAAWQDLRRAFERAGHDTRILDGDLGEHVRDCCGIVLAVRDELRLGRLRANAVDSGKQVAARKRQNR